jgi:hypothetical protein
MTIDPIRAFAVTTVLALWCTAGACAATPHVTMTLDTSGAHAVLKAALAEPKDAAAAAEDALRNPAVQAMIAKMGRYDSQATAARFRTAVADLARGGSAEPFDLARLRKDPVPAQRMLARLDADSAAVSDRVADRLAAFAPNGTDVNARLFVVVGSTQNGWFPDQTRSDFYVDLGFHGEELDSLINVSAHELFHTVQGRVRPNWDAEFADTPNAPPTARGLHRAHAVLLNLVLEGMATYVGDATKYPPAGPHIIRDQRELTRNLARSAETFALVDTVLYRARNDPDAPLPALLDIGFGGAWGQIGYYVGYRMAETIDRYSGRERLRDLVTARPEEFVAEYVRLAHEHASDPKVVPLSPASQDILRELTALGSRLP